MPLSDIKNYFFAFLFDFILFGVFSTILATIIFVVLNYCINRAELKRNLEEKKTFSANLSQRLPEMQQIISGYNSKICL